MSDPEDIHYEVTREWIDEFEQDLRAIAADTELDPRMREISRKQTESMLATLRAEAAEYERRYPDYVPSPVATSGTKS